MFGLSQGTPPDCRHAPARRKQRSTNGVVALREAVARDADAHAAGLAPVVHDLRAQGVTTLRGMTEALNERGMLTRRGGRLHVSNVKNLLDRLNDSGAIRKP